MDLKKSVKYLGKQIEELEKSIFMYEEIIKPRAEMDKVMLKKMRDQQIKLEALIRRVKAGEQPTLSEFNECVPVAFRSNTQIEG